jgi:Leucine-rich repeat (LRR) protein
MTAPASKPPFSRRWLSISLRSVLILLTALCIWLAILATRARHQAQAVAKIAARGGHLRFDYESHDAKVKNRPRPPEWLRKAVGEEYFRNVVSVGFNKNGGIGGLKVTDDELTVIDHLPGLTTVELSNNRGITDVGLKHLAGLSELRVLYLYNTSIVGPGIKDLPRNLEYLDLWFTPLEDEGLAHLKGMRKLKFLRLTNTAISDRGLADLAQLSSLEELALDFTAITDDGLEHVKSLQNLTRISLHHTKVTSRGIVDLQRSLPSCTISPAPERLEPPVEIALWPEGYQPTKAEIIAKVTELGGQATIDANDPDQPIVTLILTDSLISDHSLLTLLAQMPELRRLNLSNVLLGDALAKDLPRCEKLDFLRLMGSRLTDAGLADIARLAAMRELELGENDISDAGLAHLANMKNLRTVYVSNTRVTGEGRARLRQALPGCIVQ